MDIKQPVIHDRHIVKRAFEILTSKGKVQFEHPKDLTIVTCRNEGSMEDRIIPHLSGYENVSILESNLDYLGLDLVVLKDARLPWRNTFKFEMIHNYLNSGKCTTKYFMCCDAIDVIFIDNPQRVIDIFHTFECDALFMSTQSLDGYNCMPEVKKWADRINGGRMRYLNSGVYIGKTSFVKEMFDEAIKYAIPHGVIMADYMEYLSRKPIDYPKGSQDQDIFRYIEPKFYPRIKVDYQNLMAYRS
jgi:hypothetical protein|tara:strand:- start:274 stop:1008 length:735 start_codon:yes stop_codon:yes gene_type:complete